MEENIEFSNDHQKIFLKLPQNDQEKQLRFMNQKDDISCWSDSQNADKHSNIDEKIQNLHDLTNNNDKTIQNNQVEISNYMKNSQFELENKSTSNIYSPKVLSFGLNYPKFEDSFDSMKQKSSNKNRDMSSMKQSNYFSRRNTCLDKEPSRYNTIVTHNKHIRKLTSINHDSFNMLESKNKAFYEKIKQKVLYFYRNNTLIGRTSQLNKTIRTYINDLSDYIPKQGNFNLYNFIEYHSSLHLKRIKIPVMNPQSYIGFTLKILFSIINCFFLIYFSLLIIFNFHYIHNQLIIKLIRLIWGIEILLKFNTSLYKNSLIIHKRKQIIKEYFKFKAYIDLFPIFLISIPEISFILMIIARSCVFIKIYNIVIDLNDIQRQLCMMVKQYYIVQLFNLLCKLLLIAHIIACFWYILGLIEIHILNEEQTWFDDSIGQDGQWWKLYLSALYWALTLMTTGSNTATTVLQTFFTSFIMLFTTITFGYLLNITGNILSEMDEKDENKRKDINVINDFMRKKNISKQFQIL